MMISGVVLGWDFKNAWRGSSATIHDIMNSILYIHVYTGMEAHACVLGEQRRNINNTNVHVQDKTTYHHHWFLQI